MNRSPKFIFVIFLFPVISFANGENSSAIKGIIKNKPDAKVENFGRIDGLYREQIKLSGENFYVEFQKVFSRQYKYYLIIDACEGKFNSGDKIGYNITIIDPGRKIVTYILAMSGKNKGVDIFELQKINIEFSELGYIRGRTGENVCLSSKEVRKIRNEYFSRSYESGRFTNLTPRTRFDVACGTPEGGDMEFICFEFDKARNQFRDIGGWKNE